MLDLRIMTEGRPLELWTLPKVLGRNEAYAELGDTLEALMALYDEMSGDPDLEDGGDLEPDVEAIGEPAWTEWHTRGANKLDSYGAELVGRDPNGNLLSENDEDDDPREDEGDGELEPDAEGLTWPERIEQPSMMGGGLALALDGQDDDEPAQVPAHWPVEMVPANDREGAA